MSERHMSLSEAVCTVNKLHGLDVGYQKARDTAIRNGFPARLVRGRWQVDSRDLPKLAEALGARMAEAA